MCGCYLYETLDDQDHLYNKQWMSSEILELLGMLTLDLSYVDLGEKVMLLIETSGFLILMLAATLQVRYSSLESMPQLVFRLDEIRISDCFGLFLLILVACGKFHLHNLQNTALSLSLPIHVFDDSGAASPSSSSSVICPRASSAPCSRDRDKTKTSVDFTSMPEGSDSPTPLTRRRAPEYSEKTYLYPYRNDM
eukprot:CAMPEP_0182428924 /NCGR_PEP_ID=MMETSP1167-20130531/24600_1 /TAXON_ID=2988 /ORGANISM="Mallomonas Sp, Strain CCMP3275" /LENGTH=193 /DNA_ID=CAMNT_0024612143 /DNA_START=440 /DNA_END=1021 /DNA_ORIENTATION=+